MFLNSVILVINAAFIIKIHCFNLSPKPNLILKDPQLVTNLVKVESSYFGYSLNLRPSGVIIGAPRAQSTLPLQQSVNETGAIYRCLFNEYITTDPPNCTPYIFDDHGNRDTDENEYIYESESHDNQWLGATIDGGTKDTDKLLVCAPRFVTPQNKHNYLLHGLCYWINDTLSKKEPINVKKIISSLLPKNQQYIETPKGDYFKYSYAEQGFSAHVTPDNEKFLIGAPGIHTWKGSVVHYYKESLRDNQARNRRDTTSNGNEGEPPRKVHYKTNIPNPEEWAQENDTYFGYSVGSGYFDSNDRSKLMYVATAPQANEQSGEAYLFDIKGISINKEYTFRALETSFGEYFGYAILAEDLNGDNLTDVIVAAPLHSKTGYFDDGAIYIFINQGKFNFKRTMLMSPTSNCNARFGTTLTQLGDINHDGFNDIAIGAPFTDNGLVYIYLGSENGLRNTHSQVLESPKLMLHSYYGTHMFGHGLSKGSDIDGNGFNDLAIGAPNAEAVLLYRAYPVVKVIATLSSETRKIQRKQKFFNVIVCYSIVTTSQKFTIQNLGLRIVLDPKVKRVMYKQKNELSFNVTAGVNQKCKCYNCTILEFNEKKIFEPIELEVHYDIIHGVPDSEIFCETCAAVDPVEHKNYTHKISFNTGCAGDTCVADLDVSSYKNSSFIFGSSDKYEINYDISNYGETAYLPQINLTSSNCIPFKAIPSYCKSESDYVLICDLNQRTPMENGTRTTISIIYDVSGISGKNMTFTAQVFSAGKELTANNNKITDVITLIEFTKIDVVGAPETKYIYLEEAGDMAIVMSNYEIKSHGPSVVREMEVEFNIPIAYKIIGSSATIPIIDLNNITIQAVYDAQLIGINLFLNNTQLSKFRNFERDYSISRRHHNRYNVTTQIATKDQYTQIIEAKHEFSYDELKNELPKNRTIVFNCDDTEMVVCLRAVMRVKDFKPKNSIAITMKYHIDLNEINQILIESWEYFVVLIGLDVKKINDSGSMHIKQKLKYNIISKHQPHDTLIWIIALAVIVGLITLALISYGMYKAGFFKRAKKEEMDRLMVANLQGVNE